MIYTVVIKVCIVYVWLIIAQYESSQMLHTKIQIAMKETVLLIVIDIWGCRDQGFLKMELSILKT